MTHPAAYLPVNIGERTRFDAHGQHFIVGYHSRNTYWLSTDPPGARRRWGDRRQIVDDIEYVLRNGALPPASPRSMWEARRYSVPPEPPHHFVADFDVIRKDWGGEQVVATYRSRSEAERDCQQRNDEASELFRTGRITYDVPEFYVAPSRPVSGGHRVADFDNLDDLIVRAQQLGATHVLIAGAHTKLFFPRGGQYPYEEARVWRENRYWHAEGPGARRGVHQLPQGAVPLDAPVGQQRYTAEARRGSEETMETLAWEADDLVKQLGSPPNAVGIMQRVRDSEFYRPAPAGSPPDLLSRAELKGWIARWRGELRSKELRLARRSR